MKDIYGYTLIGRFVRVEWDDIGVQDVLITGFDETSKLYNYISASGKEDICNDICQEQIIKLGKQISFNKENTGL